jgi:hypothetical protein
MVFSYKSGEIGYFMLSWSIKLRINLLPMDFPQVLVKIVEEKNFNHRLFLSILPHVND